MSSEATQSEKLPSTMRVGLVVATVWIPRSTRTGRVLIFLSNYTAHVVGGRAGQFDGPESVLMFRAAGGGHGNGDFGFLGIGRTSYPDSVGDERLTHRPAVEGCSVVTLDIE